MSLPGTLTNHLLVAMPSLTDPNFREAVALICEHSPEKGALGIVLNKPLPMTLSQVLEQMQLEARDAEIASRSVLRGGPVHMDRGFVIHRAGGDWDSTHRVSDSIQVTTSRDVLAAMARGEGPGDAFIALGYAGWDAGQLEREVLDNAWLVLPVDEAIVFEMPYGERWPAVWRKLGIHNLGSISHVAGHA
ncbi:MAG: YqgE/AlgH family protein [Steroidobacteraceae bacterium]|nr:YqgE/AlgH family protein [Steroidobacteraceae bacterium]MDW8259745.1 YqgE/AlgH family protein [Gammaproteobacteria bacterium]